MCYISRSIRWDRNTIIIIIVIVVTASVCTVCVVSLNFQYPSNIWRENCVKTPTEISLVLLPGLQNCGNIISFTDSKNPDTVTTNQPTNERTGQERSHFWHNNDNKTSIFYSFHQQ